MATDKVVSSVAVKNSVGGLETPETPLGVDAQNVYYKSNNGSTYRVSDMLSWIENYINEGRLVFQCQADQVKNVPASNQGILIDVGSSAVIQNS